MKTPLDLNAEQLHLLGYVITWDVDKSHSVVAVREALKMAGIDDVQVCADLKLKHAFKRALRKLSKASMIDEVGVEGSKVTFQLTSKVVDENNKQLVFNQQAVLTLNLETGEVTCPAQPHVVSEAETMLEFAMDQRTGPDISRYIKRMFENHADMFPLNPKKGVTYFVPIQHNLFLEQIQRFVTALGGCFPCWPVPMGTEKGNSSVKAAVENGLEAMAAELSQALYTWDNSTREDTKKRMWDKVERLELKLKAYSSYLQDKSSTAYDTMRDLRASVVEKVKELETQEDETTAELAG